MKKALVVDENIFWWVGLHSPEKSEDLVWNSTKEPQQLVHSWKGGNPEETDFGTESCVGFDRSGLLRFSDCGGQPSHSAICQFGKSQSLQSNPYSHKSRFLGTT